MILYGSTKIYLDFEASTRTQYYATHCSFCDNQEVTRYMPDYKIVQQVILPSDRDIILSFPEFCTFIKKWFSILGVSNIQQWLSDYILTLQKTFKIMGVRYLNHPPFFPDYVYDCINRLVVQYGSDVVQLNTVYGEFSVSLYNLCYTGSDSHENEVNLFLQEQAYLNSLLIDGAANVNYNINIPYISTWHDLAFNSTDMVHICSPISDDYVITNYEYIKRLWEEH